MPEWQHANDYAQSDLIAQPRKLAAEAARDLFQKFGLELSVEILVRIQDTIGR